MKYMVQFIYLIVNFFSGKRKKDSKSGTVPNDNYPMF